MYRKLLLGLLALLLFFVTIEAQEAGFLAVPIPTYTIVDKQAHSFSTDVTLNDGSAWNVHYIHKEMVKTWNAEDILTATYYSRSDGIHWITLKNNANQESVKAKMIEQTEINAETVFVQDIDWNQVIITLNNGVRYQVKDESKWLGLWVTPARRQIEKWQVGDFVMVLLKDKSTQHILLNTTIAQLSYTTINQVISSEDVVSVDYLGD